MHFKINIPETDLTRVLNTLREHVKVIDELPEDYKKKFKRKKDALTKFYFRSIVYLSKHSSDKKLKADLKKMLREAFETQSSGQLNDSPATARTNDSEGK